LRRTYPEHEFFRSEAGLAALRRVLCALSVAVPMVGYCQGPLAASRCPPRTLRPRLTLARAELPGRGGAGVPGRGGGVPGAVRAGGAGAGRGVPPAVDAGGRGVTGGAGGAGARAIAAPARLAPPPHLRPLLRHPALVRLLLPRLPALPGALVPSCCSSAALIPHAGGAACAGPRLPRGTGRFAPGMPANASSQGEEEEDCPLR
jgi:hypothetical protein